MSSVQLITHNDRQILLMDFTTARTTADIAQTVEEIKKFVEIHQPQSLLALLDVTGTAIDKNRIRIIQGMAAHNRPYIRCIALVGVGFPKSVTFWARFWFTGKINHRVFGTREKAMEFLARV